MQVVILAGGVGGSRFVAGARRAFPDADLTVVVNTADDITLHGLRICPDLDTMMYTLGGGIDPVRGWGRAEESWRIRDELAAYTGTPPWFGLGDSDIATHLLRTQWLADGLDLAEVTARLCARWLPDPQLRLLPMTNDVVESHIVIPDGEGGRRTVHFQEYWVKLRAEPDALGIQIHGLEDAEPTPGLLERIRTADLILLAPSNPVVSIGPILGVPGVRRAVRESAGRVLGFAGILGGAPVLGMAHRLLPAIGVEVDAGAVGRHYGPRTVDGILDLWVMDSADAGSVPALEQGGLPAAVTGLIMSDPSATAEFIRLAVKATGS
jgi:LPPG:FO 2-phospho-L-lactate transferase